MDGYSPLSCLWQMVGLKQITWPDLYKGHHVFHLFSFYCNKLWSLKIYFDYYCQLLWRNHSEHQIFNTNSLSDCRLNIEGTNLTWDVQVWKVRTDGAEEQELTVLCFFISLCIVVSNTSLRSYCLYSSSHTEAALICLLGKQFFVFKLCASVATTTVKT